MERQQWGQDAASPCSCARALPGGRALPLPISGNQHWAGKLWGWASSGTGAHGVVLWPRGGCCPLPSPPGLPFMCSPTRRHSLV